MADLTADDIADMVKATLKELGRLKFQQIAQELQDYEIFTKWFKKGKIVLETGIGIQKSLMHVLTTQARHVGFTEVDVTSIIDLMATVSIPWRHATTTWSYIDQEMMMNKGDQRIFDIIVPRRVGAMLSLATELEDKAWSSPSSSSDTTQPYGIPYWVVKNSSLGFNGGAPSGHTTVGGVDPTSITKFKNYTGTYALTGGVTKTDLIKKLRTLLRKCMWKSPVGVPDYRNGKQDRYRHYTNEAVLTQIEDVGEAQNENLGRDIASMDGGDMVLRKHPIVWIPQLDGDTTNPWYTIDHSTFVPYVLKGDFLRETGPKTNADQHNVKDNFVDLTYNYFCFDRRRQGVLYGV